MVAIDSIQSNQQKIKKNIHDRDNILITSHLRPDGDAIGSIIGLGWALKEIGKNVQLVQEDGIPAKFRFLKGSELINTQVNINYELSIVLDSADINRIGKSFRKDIPDINIDHHITNEYFARINLIDPKASATAALLAEYIPLWGLNISKNCADALLTGILTDTIGFRTSNMSAKTLKLAAQLIELGADIKTIYNKALINQTFQASVLWGFALSKLKKQDELIYTCITLNDRKKANYQGKDDADLTNILSAIEDGEISILFNEQSNDDVKVSWRSRSNTDVSKIAQQFGGGGHPAAAGAEIQMPLNSAIDKVLKETQKYQENIKNKNTEILNER